MYWSYFLFHFMLDIERGGYMHLNELEYLKIYNLYLNKLLSGNNLEENEKEILKKISIYLKDNQTKANLQVYKIGTLLDYSDKLKEGFTNDDVKKWYLEDENYVSLCKKITKKNHEKRDYMFGYPANMVYPSATVDYLRNLESNNYLMNSCGDPYEKGNYQMDNKEIERMIIDLFIEKFSLEKDNFWGYITTGGTEGNVFGINNGLLRYPNANLYYFKDAHYSVSKSKISNNKMKEYETDDIESMLLDIIHNYESNGIPAILFLTYGTTKDGKIDDIFIIKRILELKGIPYYLHLDGALYGGIPNNQINAPLINIKDINPDSISVSFHKYLGVNRCNGIVLSKKNDKDNYIDYIGQNDTTVAGSRDFLAYSTYQQIKEVLTRSNPNTFNENIEYIKDLFSENNISYVRGNNNGNIFVIEKPSNELCEKYQLATFEEDGKEYAHVIVFPFHKKEIIKELVDELKKEKENVIIMKKVLNEK